MLRPIFGSGIIDSSVGVEDEMVFAVYPNPNRGSFYIDGQVGAIEILSLTGQKIPFESEISDNRTEINIISPAPGLYVLRYKQGKVIKSQKIIIRR